MARIHPSVLSALFYVVNLLAPGVFASAHAYRAPHLLAPRVDYYGGWALVAQNCPAGTTQCGNSGSCCPSSTVCRNNGGGWGCCPDTSNCVPTLKTVPVCADPAWQMYVGDPNYFCCLPNQKGSLPAKNAPGVGLCVPSDQALAITQSATKATNAPGPSPPPATAVGTPAASSRSVSTPAASSPSASASSAPPSSASAPAASTTARATAASAAPSPSASKATGSALRPDGSLAVAFGAVGSFALVVFG